MFVKNLFLTYIDDIFIHILEQVISQKFTYNLSIRSFRFTLRKNYSARPIIVPFKIQTESNRVHRRNREEDRWVARFQVRAKFGRHPFRNRFVRLDEAKMGPETRPKVERMLATWRILLIRWKASPSIFKEFLSSEVGPPDRKNGRGSARF